MISVKLNGQEYSRYLLDVNIDINESWLGKLDPNTATVKLDNSNGLFYINQYGQVVGPNDVIFQEGITATIDIDGIRKFTGYVDKQPKFSVDKKQISLSLKDKWKQFEKKRCENKVYLSTAFLTVLNDLVTQAGEQIENTNFENPELTINYWYVNEEKLITDALTELVKSVGGQLYYNENGILIFKAGFKSTFTTDVVDTFTVSNISGDFELSPNGEKYEQVEVRNKRKTLSNKLEYVYIGATEDQPFEVPPEGLPPDANDKFLAKFDDPVWWLEYYSGVEFAADAGISLNETKYNENFLDYTNHVLKNPFELDLRVDNTSGITGNITDFKIEGKKVVEEEEYYLYPIVSTNEKYTFDTELISDRTWGESLAKWLYEEVQVKPKVEIKVADFASGLNLNIGEKILVKDAVSGISHRYVIHRIKINYKNSSVTINAVQDRDAFVYDPSIVKQSKSSANAELQPLTQDISQLQSDLAATQQQVAEVDDRTSYLDSAAPSTPTNITLSSNIVEGQSTVTVSFKASPEMDVIYYEVAYTFDDKHWETVTTSDVSITFEAIANKTVWVKVRSVDAEGYFSAWSTVYSIVATKDSIPPAIPTGVTITEYFQKIRVSWNENTEEDMKDYIVQVSTSSDFTTGVETFYVDATYYVYSGQTNTTYYFRVKARDTSLNESDWTASVSGSTVQVADGELADAVIGTAQIKLAAVDDARIANLDAAKITSGYIDADRIASGTITAEKLSIQPPNSLPTGTIAYWTNSLIDEVSGIAFEGAEEGTLNNWVTLTPENAPEGSIVGDFIAGNEILAGHKITVGNIVSLGYNVLSDGTDGLKINNGKVEIQGQSSKMLLSSQGIRQIYTISMADQIDSSYSLSIPIYIPKNTDGTGVSNGIARIIVKAEKFRAYSKSVQSGGSYSSTTTSSSGGATTVTSTGGDHTHDLSLRIFSAGLHKHGYTTGSSSTDMAGNHTHNFRVTQVSSGGHTHSARISSHRHSVGISVPSHTHGIDFGIYEATNTATVTVSKGTNSWTVTTGNKLDVNNVAVADGETITISADNLARVQVYIFVEYFLY